MERQSTRKLFKLVIALAALLTLSLSAFVLGACGGGEEAHTHEFKSSGTKTSATCGSIGVETFTCSCGVTYQIITPATGSHKWGADGYCETCGLPNFGAADVTIPDGFTQEDLTAIQTAITNSQKGITDAQAEAHKKLEEALGQKIDELDTHPVHTFTESKNKNLVLPGSCTTYGVTFTISTCDVCGATFLTNIAKSGSLGHTSDGGKVVVEPTCTLFGSWQETCTVCGEVINERTLNTVAHEKGDKSETGSVPATCTDTGIDKFECKWCHKVQPEFDVVTAALGHEGQPEHADCAAEETYTWTCPRCEKEVTHTYKAGTHTWVQEGDPVITDCTSTTGKSTTYKCSVCGKEKVEETAAGGQHPAHSNEVIITIYVPYDAWETYKGNHPDAKDPANYAAGSPNYNPDNNVVHYTYYLCATCGQRIMSEAIAEHHTFRVNQDYKPTGAEKSWKELGHKVDQAGNPIAECLDYSVHYQCLDTGCQAFYDDTVKGLGHDWSAEAWDDESAGVGRPSAGWIYKSLSSCSDEGEAYRYCKRCNANEDGSLDKTKTCGYETHPVSKIPHRINVNSTNYEYVAPKCTENGYEQGDCIVCGEFQKNILKATGHNFGDWERVYGTEGAAPCQSILERKTCGNCGATEDRAVKSKFEHQAPRLWKTNVEATCTTRGQETWICDECGETWDVEVKEFGHTSAGYRVGMKNSNGIIVWNFGASQAAFNELWANYAQCRDLLYEQEFCSTCGEVYGDVIEVLPLPHSFELRHDLEELSKTLSAEELAKKLAEEGIYQPYVIVPPTCEDLGVYGYKCTRCGAVEQVGFIQNHGHWYYSISPEEAEERGLTIDELNANYLNTAEKFESACLRPAGVTVACYYCGVQDTRPGDEAGKGHKWHLLVEEGNKGVLCGEFLNSKSLAYCDACGLVIDLTGIKFEVVKDEDGNPTGEITFTDSERYAKYIKEVPNALTYLLDENGNLCVKVEDEITLATTSFVVESFKSDMIQLHQFKDEEKYRIYLANGDCSQPTAYILVCSICGIDEEGNKHIRADKDIEISAGDKSFYDYMQEYTRAYVPEDPTLEAVQEAYKALGYTIIPKTKNITVKDADGNDKLVSLNELYLQYVTAEELAKYGLTLAEGEELHAPSYYYTWYNFAAFTYSNEGHIWLTNNKECVVDPILTMIFEDWAGSDTSKSIILKRNNGAGVNGTNTFTNDETMTFEVALGKYIGSLGTDGDSAAKALADLKETYADWLNVKMHDYRDVVENLIGVGSKSYPDNYKGISNWCTRAADGKCTLTTTAGFQPVIAHSFVYQIAENPSATERTYYEDQFTYGLDGTKTLPRNTITNWSREEASEWSKDLLFLQLLKNNATDLEKEENEDNVLRSYYDSYKTKGFLKYDVIVNGALACNVRNTCLRCGEAGVGGKHQQDLESPEFGANCQRGPKCVVCGKIIGQPGFHNLVDATDPIFAAGTTTTEEGKYYNAFKALMEETGFKTLVLQMKDNENTCWLAGGAEAYDKLKVCVGCLEAWYDKKMNVAGAEWFVDGKAGTWALKTVVLGDTAVDGAKACTPKGSSSGSLSLSAEGVECNSGHIHFTEGTTEENITKAMEEKGFNSYVIKVADDPDEATLPHTFTISEADGDNNAKNLIKQFPDLFPGVDVETISVKDAYAKVKTLVEGYKYKLANSYTAEPEVAVDEKGYLVLHYEEELTDGYCQAPSWDEDLCYACTLHFVSEGLVDTTIADTTAATDKKGTFGIRKDKIVDDTARAETDATTGHYNDNKNELRHVYAPAASWTWNESNPDYVEVVCLRCHAFDTEVLGGTVAKWLEGMRQHTWFYFATAAELDAYTDETWTIDDKDDFLVNGDSGKEFIAKAKDYDGKYSYATTSTEAAAELKETVAEGGVVELAEGIGEVTLDSALTPSKDTEIDLNGNTLTFSNDIAASSTVSGNLTIKGGTLNIALLNGADIEDNKAQLNVSGTNSKLTLDNVVVNSETTLYASLGGTLELIGCFVRANGPQAIAVNNTTSPCTIIIKDSTIASLDQKNGEKTGNNGNVGLVVNNVEDVVEATNSTFYGVCTGAWVRSGKATFTGCTFISGSALIGKANTESDAWGAGTVCAKDAKAALLIGNGGSSDNYGSAEVTLNSCKCIVSREVIKSDASEDQYTPAEGNLVTVNDNAEDNSARITATTYTPAEGAQAAKPIVLAVYNASTVKLTLDTASATAFGVTTESMVKDKNVYVNGSSAAVAQITITINGGTTFSPKEG